ncbi:MAG: hypothetical protein LAT84_00860 [Balneolia bacterium]|nr:hypothetical protein [Balneolia bacterium]
MKFSVLIFFLFISLHNSSVAQPSSFTTGLGVEIEGDFSLTTHELNFSFSEAGVHTLANFSSNQFATESRPDFSNPTFRYSQSTLYTHSHRRNADAFTNWQPVDDRYENRTQIVIDGVRGLFRVIRTSGS